MQNVTSARVSSLRASIGAYIGLMKPHVTVLLLGTTLAAMAVAGLPSLPVVLATLLGGACAAGSANAINCYWDRDIDQIMSRTRTRALPSHKVGEKQALVFGISLGVASFVVLGLVVNLLAALLALAAIGFYVGVYTMWLKRTTPQNIVIGGAAGAIPPLVGWAAVTGGLDLTAVSLFLVIFLWTPPHFWALAQLIARDYRQAGVPMMPVVHSTRSTKRQSVGYAVATVAVSVVPYFTGDAGVIYLVGAVVLGVGLIGVSVLDLHGRRWTVPLFAYSIAYLAALFTVLAIAGLFA
jgi:protoheme IX farnesyltransferase